VEHEGYSSLLWLTFKYALQWFFFHLLTSLFTFLLLIYLVLKLHFCLGRMRKSLIKAEKTITTHGFEENVERFLCSRFSVSHPADLKILKI
jgi:hypothetical protein